jgi:DNA-binding winged helix-turn-helix (wHTH) protein
LRYVFEDYSFDRDRRELHRGAEAVTVAPQVFDLLDYLIRNRERVVSKDDLINAVWDGRVVSDAALTTRLNVARGVIGDSGQEQRLIKTLPRKGFRFTGLVQELDRPESTTAPGARAEPQQPALTLPDGPSIAVLPFQNMSGDPEQDYFADGIVDDIITALSGSSFCSSSPAIRVLPTRAGRSISNKSDANSVSVTFWRAVSARSPEGFASPAS